MNCTRAAFSVAAALVLGSNAALAADLNMGGAKGGWAAPMPAPMPSIYLRVDGGYAIHDEPEMTESGIYTLSDTGIEDTWTVGGGIGTYFGRNIRGDITVDHRFEADATGTLLDNASTLQGTRRFGISSTVALANLYYDFDLGGRFTPYIGVGLGFVHHRTKAGTVVHPCGYCEGEIDGASNTHVAGALMAGFTTRLRGGEQVVSGGSTKDAPMVVETGRGLYLDVGYRFLYLGETETGPVRFTGTSPGEPNVSDDPTVKDMHAHEFRVGLRYDLR
jgi:opacity protein-like surface antigen